MDITFVEAWRKNDPALEEAALAFWRDHEALTEEMKPEERVKEIAVLAYGDGKLIGLSTLKLRYFEQMRQKFVFVREIVAREHRLEHISIALTQKTKDCAETYAAAHPEEGIMGMAAVFQAPGIGKRPISRGGAMVLIGYTPRNEQVRAVWFAHARVPALGS
jgi:hypothetical protein